MKSLTVVCGMVTVSARVAGKSLKVIEHFKICFVVVLFFVSV